MKKFILLLLIISSLSPVSYSRGIIVTASDEPTKKIECPDNDPMNDPTNSESQHKNAFKIGLLSPIFGATSFTFERSLKPGNSFEATVGIIGLGTDFANNKSSGVYMKLGYKFMKSPDTYQKMSQYAHILKGAYLRPEISFSNYKSETGSQFGSGGIEIPDSNSTGTSSIYGVAINVGKQWIFQDKFLFDFFTGLGYGFGNSFNGNTFHFAFKSSSPGSSFTITAGLRIGILF